MTNSTLVSYLQACRKRKTRQMNEVHFSSILHCRDLTSFSNHMRISNNSKIHQSYHCGRKQQRCHECLLLPSFSAFEFSSSHRVTYLVTCVNFFRAGFFFTSSSSSSSKSLFEAKAFSKTISGTEAARKVEQT